MQYKDGQIGDEVKAFFISPMYWTVSNLNRVGADKLLEIFPVMSSTSGKHFIIRDKYFNLDAGHEVFEVFWVEDHEIIFHADPVFFDKVQTAIIKSACRCSLLTQGCSCGIFEKEMKEAGRTYNKWTRSWE